MGWKYVIKLSRQLSSIIKSNQSPDFRLQRKNSLQLLFYSVLSIITLKNWFVWKCSRTQLIGIHFFFRCPLCNHTYVMSATIHFAHVQIDSLTFLFILSYIHQIPNFFYFKSTHSPDLQRFLLLQPEFPLFLLTQHI